METDLARIVRELGESHRSGPRVQALQQDVETSLVWLETALREEMQEREQQEQQEQQQQEQQDQGEQPLVPDVAELKLLRQLQVQVLERKQQILHLHPELGQEDAEVDPFVLEDFSRLAYKQRRLIQLWTMFRERLGIPGPEGTPDE